MLLSQRLIIRRNQAIGVQIPDEPDSVTDAIVLKLCALSGRHQRIISVARCYRLTNHCLENIGRCLGLQYLNLSYTKVENISPLMNLPMLRSLSLAGLVLINYEDLRWLVTVEILNLQYSNFSKPELLSDFNLLRSLDLGNTMISSISDLRRLDRLEELCLDSTKCFKDETISESIQTLQCFPDLKYLQIGNSPLVKSFHTLQQSISPLTSIITKPRRISWFENVINNNHEEVQQMILNGQDVNLRSGPEDIDLFTFYYFHKCQMKTQYFDCCSLVEIYRPCATHVAIFFNCKETLELLIAAQCKRRCSVWYGKVNQVDDEVVVSDDDESFFDESLAEEEEEEEGEIEQQLKQLQQSRDQTKLPRRARSGEILPTKTWRRQSTFRKHSIAQILELGSGSKQQSSQLLPPLTLSLKDQQMNPISPTTHAAAPERKRSNDDRLNHSFRKGSVINRPTFRANSMENAKSCITNDLEDFIERVYESGAHRITERMTERRITGWKQECRVIADRLKPVLAMTKLVTTLDAQFNHIPFFGSSSMAEEGFSPTVAMTEDKINLEGEGRGETESKAALPLSSLRNELTSAPLSVNGDISLDLETAPKNSSEGNPEGSSQDKEEDPFASPMQNSSCCSSTIPIKTMEYIPSVLELAPYETLVSKLHQPQKIVLADEMNSKNSETITILGPKSYEDEGRIETIRLRVQRDEEDRERYLKDHPVVYDPSSSEYFFAVDHYVTRQERKKMLISHIRDRKEML